MTKERREEVVLLALVASVLIHAGLMVLVKTQVMTQVNRPAAQARRAPMRMTKSVTRPDPVKIDKVLDEAALKDAPPVREAAGAPRAPEPSAADFKVEIPRLEVPLPETAAAEAAPVLDARPVGGEVTSEPPPPVLRVETPKATPAAETAPAFAAVVPKASAPSALARPLAAKADPGEVFLPARLTRERGPKATFTPASEVYAKVDEKVVAEEKAAVRSLIDVEDVTDMEKFVNVTMAAAEEGGWRYFKVMMTPRASLRTVPKDVVVIIDGSGSIGNDRLGSCRKAARRILRTATNTGDRFNLVVFRNAFSYAFRNWRECDAASFAAGDKWLANQTAHGRTDIFSTISSVLALPRDPKRPIVALVVTDGDANAGVSETSEILSKFTLLNGGLISVYMYGVKSSANRELIDVLTHGNRGESFVFEGWRWSAGDGMDALSERFRDPVLSDLGLIFSAGSSAEVYPRRLRNLYKGATLTFVGRVPANVREIAFSLRGLNGDEAYEGFFKLPFETAARVPSVVAEWSREQAIDMKLRKE